jgi:hypothetical protein
MTELLIRHRVGDYETFKKIFLEDQERRRSTGSTRARVLLNADDRNDVWVVLEYDNAEQAREHAHTLELNEAIKWATGNISMPEFVVLENAMETDA